MARGLALALILLALAGCGTAQQPNDRSMATMPFDKLIRELAKPIE